MSTTTATAPLPGEPQDLPLIGLLDPAASKYSLILVMVERLMDARPLSLVIASGLSTGDNFGDFSMAGARNILHVDGELPAADVQRFLESSALHYNPEKILFFSLATVNSNKEDEHELDLSLADIKSGLYATLEETGCDVAIIYNLATASNHFLNVSEIDVLKAIQMIRRKANVIVFSERGGKGSSSLQSMADFVLEVSKAENHFDAPVNIACVKHPATVDLKPFCLSLSCIEGGRWSVTQVNDADQLLDMVIDSACLGKTQSEIGNYLGLQQYQVSRLLTKAEKLGLIVRIGRTVKRI